uniref:Uncharacterized protein n=1 Tax=Panagrolaimus davidi TaxID=227884 RepID=A0A914QRF1_9BILA
MLSSNIFGLTVGEFKFTSNGYKLIKHKTLSSLNVNVSPEILCHQICGSLNHPQKIIISSFDCERIPFFQIFKSANLIFINEASEFYWEKFVVKICKWLFDKSFIKYYILPTVAKSIRIYGYFGSTNNISEILNIKVGEKLPLTKTAIISKSVPEIYAVIGDKRQKFRQKMKLPENCHRFQISVTIDEENFESIEILPKYFKGFDKILTKIDAKLESKISLIGFYDNSSVICIYKNSEERYKFLDEWNGMYGNNCFISFDQKRPKFGQKAMDSLNTKNTSVIFDLIKTMSMSPENIIPDKKWGFTIIKNAENQILLKFVNFDGRKKRSTPAFLMALLLRKHLKVIERKIGEKPTQTAFWIMKQKYSEEEIQRIKEGLKKSCKFLKIDCIFVDFKNFCNDFGESK